MDEKPVGAIWKKISQKNGKEYLSIKIGEIQFIAFLNDKGGVETRPDYQVYTSKPREAQSAANSGGRDVAF
jgi:uncharacterized protein (DUF736 family)